MLVQIDGFFVPEDEFDGTSGASLTIELNNGLRSTSFTNELTFFGETKKYIVDRLYLSTNPLTEYITLRLFDECCVGDDGTPLKLFTGKATRDDSSLCEDFGVQNCGVSCSFVDDGTVSQKTQCVRNTLIHALREPNGRRITDGEDEYRSAPFFGYYEETRPKSFSFVIAYLLIIVLTIYLPLTVVFRLLTLGFLDMSIAYSFLIDTAFKKRYHKSPFVHSYLVNVCRICGLTLSSSLFEPSRPLHNMTRLDAPFSEGGASIGEARQVFRDFNRPNITLPQLMESFKELNIGYVVTDTQLIVERIDRLTGGVWIDFTTRPRVLKKCYNASDNAQPAGEVFSYGEDQSDKVGNEATRLWSGDAVDYNTPLVPVLRGIRQTIIQYGSTRFVNDASYTGQSGVLHFLRGSGYFSIVTFNSAVISPTAIIAQTGVFSLPKLLMHDGTSSANNALVERINGISNARLWLREDMATTYNAPGLYDLLLFINDPRLNLQRNLSFEIVANYTCEDLRTIDTARTVRFEFLDTGQIVEGTIDSIQVGFDNSEITITGKI